MWSDFRAEHRNHVQQRSTLIAVCPVECLPRQLTSHCRSGGVSAPRTSPAIAEPAERRNGECCRSICRGTAKHPATVLATCVFIDASESTLEVESAGQRGRTATGSGRNGNEAVAGAVSEAFARWLHVIRALSKCISLVTQAARKVPFGSVYWIG